MSLSTHVRPEARQDFRVPRILGRQADRQERVGQGAGLDPEMDGYVGLACAYFLQKRPGDRARKRMGSVERLRYLRSLSGPPGARLA